MQTLVALALRAAKDLHVAKAPWRQGFGPMAIAKEYSATPPSSGNAWRITPRP